MHDDNGIHGYLGSLETKRDNLVFALSGRVQHKMIAKAVSVRRVVECLHCAEVESEAGRRWPSCLP